MTRWRGQSTAWPRPALLLARASGGSLERRMHPRGKEVIPRGRKTAVWLPATFCSRWCPWWGPSHKTAWFMGSGFTPGTEALHPGPRGLSLGQQLLQGLRRGVGQEAAGSHSQGHPSLGLAPPPAPQEWFLSPRPLGCMAGCGVYPVAPATSHPLSQPCSLWRPNEDMDGASLPQERPGTQAH